MPGAGVGQGVAVGTAGVVTGVGLGVARGVAMGDGEGVGDGEGDGEGVGESVGVAVAVSANALGVADCICATLGGSRMLFTAAATPAPATTAQIAAAATSPARWRELLIFDHASLTRLTTLLDGLRMPARYSRETTARLRRRSVGRGELRYWMVPCLDISVAGRSSLPVMKISEVAEKVGVSTKAIRFYEAAGVLPPAQRAANRYREYTESDLMD
jgi:MerR family regulatory protein